MDKDFKLTQRTVEAATCPPGRKDVLLFDGETRGFALRVTKGGGKTFLAQYTVSGQRRRVPLGAFGVLTVKAARKAAQAVLGEAAGGTDPFAERKAKELADRAARAADEYTLAKLVADWSAARAGDRRPTYLREAVACLRRNLPDGWDKPAASMAHTDATRVLDALKAAKGTVAANRTLAYASAAYGWALRHHKVTVNPFRGVERPGREVARERVLTADELGAVWRACDKLGPTLAAFVRVLMLTLARRDEIASMRWAELDNPADPAVWTLPAERSKNGRGHVVHLAEPVRAVIRAMPKIAGNPFVFAGQGAKPIAAFNYAKAELVDALAEAGTPPPDWRFHDFRRAGVTALAGMGFPPHVADRLLNHIGGSIQGVAAVYQRHEFLAERKAALDAWAAHVTAAAVGTPAPGNVVPLKRAG